MAYEESLKFRTVKSATIVSNLRLTVYEESLKFRTVKSATIVSNLRLTVYEESLKFRTVKSATIVNNLRLIVYEESLKFRTVKSSTIVSKLEMRPVFDKSSKFQGHRGCDRMVVAISAYHQWCCEFESCSGRGVQHYVIKFVSDLRQVIGFLRVLRFPPSIKLSAMI